MPIPERVAVGVADEVQLGVTKDTVYAWIADRGMPAHKVDRLWKFQADEVDEWVRHGGTGAKCVAVE